jgi:cytochrome P450
MGVASFYPTRGILHDPEVYFEPSVFDPWRWLVNTAEGPKLNEAMPDPTAAFGFGRR